MNGDADEPHDVGYAYDYCVVQCPKIIEKNTYIYYKIFPKNFLKNNTFFIINSLIK